MYDAVRKAIELIHLLCDKHNILGWRQFKNNIKAVKKAYREVQKAKKARGKDDKQKQKVSDKLNNHRLKPVG